MNFSNFIIGKLTEADPSLSLGTKKPGSSPFLFADIIKVCEQEGGVQNASTAENEKNGPTLEVFASTENVIKVSQDEFLALTQLIESLISQNKELQPTETAHKIEDADITKLQFILPEDKLVELTGEFIDKTSFSLIPLTEQNNSLEAIKPLTVSYKSGSNKLSVTINPIKIDENYTTKVINDEFGFVNKLLVNEDMLQNVPLIVERKDDLASEELAEIDNYSDESSESVAVEENKEDVYRKVFYKAEIIKIESHDTKHELNSSSINVNNNSHSELINVNSLFQQNDKAPATVEIEPQQTLESSISNVSSEIAAKNVKPRIENNPEQFENTVADKVELPTNVSASKLTETAANPNQKADENILADKINGSSTTVSFSDLMEGLTEEEKSVFKGFAARNEIKEIKYESSAKPAVEKLEDNSQQKKVKAAELKVTGQTESKTKDYAIPKVALGNEKVEKPAVGTENDKSVETLSVKENIPVKTEKNTLGVSEKSLEEKTVVKNEFVNYTVISKTNAKESKAYQNESRPKLVSKEEFIAIKENSENILPKAEDVEFEAVTTKESEKENNSVTVEEKKQSAKPEAAKTIEISDEGKLFVKVSAKAALKVEKSAKHELENKSADEPAIVTVEKDNTEKLGNESIGKVETKRNKEEQVVVTLSTESHTTKEKVTITKPEIETKETVVAQNKETKHTTEQQLSQQSEKENGKPASQETFKNHLNQVGAVDKNFETENLKPHVELKQPHEVFKTIKQQEIIPEFSKLVLQGEKQTLTLQLTPENLGKVKLVVDMIENQIVTKIEVENEQVKQFVQSNLEQLKQNMQSAGVPLTSVNVSLSDEQKNQKVYTQKKKSLARDKEEIIEETTTAQAKKHMGYNTYEYTA